MPTTFGPDRQARADFRASLPSYALAASKGSGRAFGVVALLMMVGAGAVWADFPGDVPDRFKIQLGGVDANFNTDASLTSTDIPANAFINFEDIFKLPVDQRDWNVGGFYRFSGKGYLDFGYEDFERTAQVTLDRDIQWGEYTFQANGQVKTNFGTAFAYLAYRHDFLQLEQVHISLSAGFSYLILESGLKANGNVIDQDGNAVSGEVDQQANVSFPVPLIGLQLDWKLTKRTAIKMQVRTLHINYGDFDGGIKESAIFYEWYMTRHFAIGGGFVSYNISIKRYDTGDYTARFEYDVDGPELYLKLAF